MTSEEIQKAIYAALSADPALSTIKVVKYYEEADGQYPFIVFKEISNVPALHADNKEVAARVTYQISIVTNDDDYAAIEENIKAIMTVMGFLRVDSEELHDGDDYMRVLRFCRAVES